MTATATTPRTQLKRQPARGVYDRAVIERILDHGFVCHVGFVFEGRPVCLPMVYGRLGDAIYLHGSPASRLLRTLRDGAEAAVTVTHVDGLVLARSAFHHSANYRSVAIYGCATEVMDAKEKLRALEAVVDHALPGRFAEVRGPSLKEFHQTLVLRIPIAEASAKVRSGGPIDEEADLALDVWAGVVPLALAPGEPIADPGGKPGVAIPAIARDYRRPPGTDARGVLEVMTARDAG